MPSICHFEIHADQIERAARFYRAVFNWKVEKWGGPVEYWLITTGPEGSRCVNGGMVQRQGAVQGNAMSAFVCTIDVPSIDEFINKVTANGGSIALPKSPIPGIGWLAYCKDTEGNTFGMLQPDQKAA